MNQQDFTAQVDNNDEVEEQKIFEEYKIWKKNAPFFYDTLYSHALTWPSLSIEWMPNRDIPYGSDSTIQKLLIGTHTSNDEQNYVQILKVKIPLDSSKDTRDYRDNDKDDNNNMNNTSSITNGIGGTGQSNKTERISVDIQINHQGEVNKARHMPQQHQFIATKTTSGEVHIFNYFLHSATPTNDEVKPNLRLLGHSKEGYGLSWNPQREGRLISGSDDNLICLWDIQSPNSLSNTLEPVAKFEDHNQVVEDVCWNNHDLNQFASVSDDKKLKIWDDRKPQPCYNVEAHVSEIMSVDYSPFDQYLMITGSADTSVAVWDTRNLKTKLFSLRQHKDEVNQVRFSKQQCNLLASSSSDRRIMVWDLSRYGAEQTEEEKRDGPPELLFVHGGHTSKVSDLSWNPNEKLMLSSCAEDNILQVWQIGYDQYYNKQSATTNQQSLNV